MAGAGWGVAVRVAEVVDAPRLPGSAAARKKSNLRAQGGDERVAWACGRRGGIKELSRGQPAPRLRQIAHYSHSFDFGQLPFDCGQMRPPARPGSI